MPNEIIFILTAFTDLSFILLAYQLGKNWLYATIIINLVLISTFGAKLISIFGFVTNTGNVFFAAVFLATHILTEHYGKREGYKTVWIGFAAIVFFILMSQFTLQYAGLPASSVINQAQELLFIGAPRIALASMVGYILVQYFNVWIYDLIHAKTGRKLLWLRDTIANFTGQFLDSILFFSIAFYGIIPIPVLLQTMLAGFAIKVIVGLMGTPILYLTFPQEVEKK